MYTSRAVTLGRVLLSVIFFVSAAGKLMNWEGTAGFVAQEGLRFPMFFLTLALLLELGGAVLLLSRRWAGWGALLLLVFLVPTTIIMHDFWTYSGAARQMQMMEFLKNVAIMGGLVLVTATVGVPEGARISSPFRRIVRS